MSISNVFVKDPNSTLDFGFDWSQWLDTNEIIIAHDITVSGCGLVNLYSTTTTAGSVIVWLTSGCVGARYTVACLISTSGSRVDERSIKIDCRER